MRAVSFMARTKRAIPLMERLREFLTTEIKPVAPQLDHDPKALNTVFRAFNKKGFLGVRVPAEYGGAGFTAPEYHVFKREMARYSGALTFLQTQHQTATQLILSGVNEELKKQCLPEMCTGSRLIGMALSPHLANWQTPSVTAEVREDGYFISRATIRLATGYEHFDSLIIGFVANDSPDAQKEITALVPFRSVENAEGGRLKYSSPLALSVASSTNTVSLEIVNWHIPKRDVVTTQPMGYFAKKSLTTTNLDSYLAGVICEMLSLVDLHVIARSPIHAEISAHHQFLQAELVAYEHMIVARDKDTPVASIRAIGVDLCNKCDEFIAQIFRGRLIMSDDSVAKTFRRLQEEGKLYSVVTSYDDLLQATMKLGAQSSVSAQLDSQGCRL